MRKSSTKATEIPVVVGLPQLSSWFQLFSTNMFTCYLMVIEQFAVYKSPCKLIMNPHAVMMHAKKITARVVKVCFQHQAQQPKAK